MTDTHNFISRQLTVVGHGTCGKTSLLNRHLYKKYDEHIESTVFTSTKTEYKYDGNVVELKLWDTAGQEEFVRLRDLALPNAHYVLICFNVDSRQSFTEVRNTFIPQIKEINPTCKLFLAATKIDLRNDNDTLEQLCMKRESVVTKEEGVALAKEIGAIAYFESSAKDNHGVDEIFDQIAKYAYKENEREQRSWISNLLSCFMCC